MDDYVIPDTQKTSERKKSRESQDVIIDVKEPTPVETRSDKNIGTQDLMEDDYKQDIRMKELFNSVADLNTRIQYAPCRYRMYHICGISFFIVATLSHLSTIYHNF